MNYDSIILEMLSRIQALEQKVGALEELLNDAEALVDADAAALPDEEERRSTGDVREHIRRLLRSAAAEGRRTVILRAGDVQQAMGMKNRVPMVCNAMRQCMGKDDVVLHQTPSGNSTTLEIQYDTAAYAEDADD